MIKLIYNRSTKSKTAIALAHGAGVSARSAFMDYFAKGVAAKGFTVVRFDFPYMTQQQKTGKKRAPNTLPILCETWRKVILKIEADKLIIGGKSMGGRIASVIADEQGVDGLVCLGYPFHPPGKPGKTRIEHLQKLKTRTLILQGERDPFGNRDDVNQYPLSNNIKLYWLTAGDHSFTPRKKSGLSEKRNWDEAIREIAVFAGKI